MGSTRTPAAELLERDASIALLTALLAEVRAGGGHLVLVAGEAGSGKTTLLRWFCDHPAAGTPVRWGACVPLRTQRALAPFADLLGEPADGRRPHEAVGALLEVLEAEEASIVVLEDLHWGDEATLDALALLATRVGSVPALVLASYRDEEVDRASHLRFVLGELTRGAHRLWIDPLSPAAVAALAAPHGLDGAELHRRTGGNAFYVTEAIAAAGERIPATVRDAVLARAGALSPGAHALLDAVAVSPGGSDVALLEAMAGDDVAHLAEAVTSGMLRSRGAHVSFRHELAALAIEEAMAPDRRVALHRAALAALAARGGAAPDAPRLAHHAEAAGDADAVLRWAPAAAEEAAASGAHREAAAQYARALGAREGLTDARRAELLERRADECYLTSRLDDAIAAQEEALACRRRSGDARAEGDALRALSRLLFFAGRTREGAAAAQAAVDRLTPLGPGRELAMAYANRSQRAMVVEDNAAAVRWGERAVALADELGDAEVRVYALTNIAMAELQAGVDAGMDRADEALQLARRHGLDDHAGRVYLGRILFPLRARRFADVATQLDEGLAFCTERGLETWRLYLLACRARMQAMTGRWEDAAGSAGLVLRDPRSASLARNWALAALGLLAVRRGDDDAGALLDEAWALADGTDELLRVGPVAAARAEQAWLCGDDDAVLRVTEDVLEHAVRRRAGWVAGELGWWRALAGGREDAASDVALPAPCAAALAGDWTAAADAWAALDCAYEAAIANAQSADVDRVRAGVEALQDMGARPAATAVARRLRERGMTVPRGPRTATRENPAGLTAREVEVLALLAEGLRNAQIAERLVVAEKTIHHHVSSILRKLDASTRGEAAAKGARLGLVDRA